MHKRPILLLASLSLAACSAVPLKDGNCYIGEAGCTCTSRGGCDPGLECNEDRVCAKPPDGTPEWIPLDDTGGSSDLLGSHEVARDFYDLLVVERRIFLTYSDEHMIRVLDLEDGSVTDLPVYWPALEMAFDASTGTVVVTLPNDEPNAQDGHLALVQLASLDRQIVATPIPLGDVVTNGAGTAFVALGGSPRPPWSALAIDLTTGKYVQHFHDDYVESRDMAMHPDGDRIYAFESNSWPANILRWNVAGAELTDTQLSDARFDYGNMRVDPLGTRAYLMDGTVIRLDDDPESDMVPSGALGPDGRWEDLVFDPSGTRLYAVPTQGRGVSIFDAESQEQVGSFRPKDDVLRLASGRDSLFVVEGSILDPSTMVRIDEVPFP